MPPRKQIGKGKSPVLDIGDISLEEKEAKPTSFRKIPLPILRESMKRANLSSAASAASASKLFNQALSLEEHPEHVSHLHTLLSTQRKQFSARSAIQESIDYCPTLQRLSYGVSKGFYTYDLATNESEKYPTGNDDHTIKKTAFSMDGTILVVLDNWNHLRVWKYDNATKKYAFVKLHESHDYNYCQSIQPIFYHDHLFIVVITAAGGSFVVHQTTMEPETPFAVIRREHTSEIHAKNFATYNEKIILATDKGFRAYIIEPKPRTREFQLTSVRWNQPDLQSSTIPHPHYVAFDSTGTQFITLYTTGFIQTSYPKTNALNVWRWAPETNRIEPVRDMDVASTITEKDRAFWRIAAFSPNGRYVAALSFARSLYDDTEYLYTSPCIDLWEVASGRHVRTIQLKAKDHTVRQVVQIGFYKKDKKDSIFFLDNAFQVYSFAPGLSFSGGRRKQIGKGKSPALDIEGITLEDAPAAPTTLYQMPKDVIGRILKQSSLSTAASAVSSVRFLKEALPLNEHPAFVSLKEDLMQEAYGDLIYAPVSQQVIYKSKNRDTTHLFHTYDVSTGETKTYQHGDTAFSFYMKLYASKDGSMLLTRPPDASAFIKVWKWNPRENQYTLHQTYTAPDPTLIKLLRSTTYRIVALSNDDQGADTRIQFDVVGFYPIIVQPMPAPGEVSPFGNFHAIYYLHSRHQVILIKGNTISGFAVEPPYYRINTTPVWSHTFTTLNTGDTLIIHTLEDSRDGTQFAVLFSKYVLIQGTRTRSVENHIALWDWPGDAAAPVKKDEIHALSTPGDEIVGRVCAYSPNGNYLAFLSAMNKTYWVHVWDIKAKQDATEPIRLRYKTNDSTIGKTIMGATQLGFYKKDNKDHVAVITGNKQVFSFSPEIALVGGRRRRATRAVQATRK